MPRGGYRPGAGRPKKPLNEKIIEGNPGKRELTTLKFPDKQESFNNPTKSKKYQNPPSHLDAVVKEARQDLTEGCELPTASEIYKLLHEYISSAGCDGMVAPQLIENFAILHRAFLECESVNRKLGRIVDRKRSPYISMALDYQKAMMAIYDKIWLIVSRNCEEPYGEKNGFLDMLKNRGF